MIVDKENIVKIFIDSKADMIDVKNDVGETPLFMAAGGNGTISFVLLYILNKPLNNVNVENFLWFFLFLIVLFGYKIDTENLVKYLISKGADVNSKSKFGETPLHACASVGKFLDILNANGVNYSI